ncbi:MAG: PAS domain S-box protein, partial [Gallionella sp.]|nr:PAS domain S-box protein [Gallionella sp.]
MQKLPQPLCQALLQNSMEGIHIMDIDGNVIEVNDAFCKMLGYTREEALRLNVTDWDARWSAIQLRERFESMVGKSARFETVQRCKDGTVLNV